MKKIIFIFSLFFSIAVFSQLQVNFPAQLTPSQLVQNVLLGSNVTATNITFNGSAANATVFRDQAGLFSTNFNPTNLGLESGVLLTTGQTSVALGPNDDTSDDLATANPPFRNDPDLAILAGRPVGEINNCSVLEFDFVATGETLNFDFIFASEEYPVYSENPLFNDSFGFFLSGPGITGPFSGGAKNIALVPSTTTPVSIATINNGTNNDGAPCVNCTLYYNNTNIGVNPTTWTGQTTQYNGFTTVLTATSSLQCGQTYHIKLAISNVGTNDDNFFDSAVFLKAGSFNVIPLNLGTDLTNITGSGVCDGGNVTLNTGLPITYTFVWKKDGVVIAGQTGPSLLVITPGTYEVSATTASGCPLTPDAIIVEFKPAIAVGLPQNLTVCDTAAALETFNLTTNTSLVLAALTPVSDYVVTYHTSQTDADNDANPIPNALLSVFQSAGQTIYVRVTDFELCFKVQSFTLNVITNPSGTIFYPSSPYCSDLVTAQPVTSTVPSGGTYTATPAGLSINATSGAITPSLSTFGTTYTVTYNLPASGSCPAYSTNTIVTINPLPSTPTFTNTQPTCTVGTGSITFTSPLVAGLEYSINNGTSYQASPLFTTVPPGPYTLIVRNTTTLCTSNIATVTINPALGVPATPVATATQQPTCTTPTGTITITAPSSGGPYEYSNNAGAYQTGLTFTGLAPGSSNIISIRDTTTGCVATASAITINAIPANPAAPTASVTVQPTCPIPTGTIVISAPTGAAYEYSINGTTYQAGATFASLIPATYNVTVREIATGCVSVASVQTVNAVPGAPALPTASLTQPTCTTNTGAINITNVLANLEYSINSGAFSATSTFSGLAAGLSYTITVRDTTTGCTSVQNFAITPALNVPTVPTASFSQPNCNTPAATLTVSSTGSNLEYNNNGGAFQSSNIFTALAPGSSNTIIVRNSVSGCTATAPAFIAPAITPNPAEVVASPSQPNCITTTGTITITAPTSGGPYQFSNNGGPFQSGLTFTGLAAGSINSIVVRDMTTGCVSTGIPAINIPAITTNPAVPTASVTVQPTCTIQTATIEVNPAFGTGFQYSINGGTSYQASPIFTNVTANSNQVITVQNISTGCINTTLPIPVNPVPPIPTTPIALGSNVCVGDTIILTTATVVGATYTWSGPNGFTSTNQNPTIINATVGMSGNYSVIIRLVADCPSLAGTVAVTVNPIPVVSLNNGYVCVDQNNVVLNTFTLDTQLLSSDYSFQWFTLVGATQTPIAAADGGTGSSYTASAPGNYGVIITSTSTTPNCPSELITAQVGKSSPPISFVATPSNYFAELQSVTVNNVLPAGGTYEYQIDNGGYQTSNVFNNIGSGQHTIDVRDINQCGVVSNTTNIIDFPKYFTPNGDGYHDTWNISALNNQPNSKISIFDRFGKLLKQIVPSGTGWDGTFNQEELPSTDYWFVVNYEENGINKELKSHFAMKR